MWASSPLTRRPSWPGLWCWRTTSTSPCSTPERVAPSVDSTALSGAGDGELSLDLVVQGNAGGAGGMGTVEDRLDLVRDLLHLVRGGHRVPLAADDRQAGVEEEPQSEHQQRLRDPFDQSVRAGCDRRAVGVQPAEC